MSCEYARPSLFVKSARIALRRRLIIVVASLLLAPSICNGAEYAPGEVLVKFKDDVSTVGIRSIVGPGTVHPAGRLKRVILAPGADVEQEVARLNRQPEVEYAQPVFIKRLQAIPNDPLFSQQWSLRNLGQAAPSVGTPGADINVVPAWDITTGSRDIVVAVIDTGVDLVHPELAQNIWTNPNEIPGDGIDNDNDGFVDDVHGWDWVTNQPVPLDVDGHGTLIAGIIGAVGDNRSHIAGVNWQVSLMPLKVFDSDGGAKTTSIVDAIDYAVAHGADIINASYGAPDSAATAAFKNFDSAEFDAFRRAQQAGVLVVASACNNLPFGISNDDLAHTCAPASYPLDNIVAVGASNNNDALADFSNFGLQTVDLVAPGVDIITTTPAFRRVNYLTHVSNLYEKYDLTNQTGCKAYGAAVYTNVTEQDPGTPLGNLFGNGSSLDLTNFDGLLKAETPPGDPSWTGVTVLCYDAPGVHGVSTQNGTSVSAPLVSGVAALALAQAEAQGQSLGIRALRDLLLSGVDRKPLLSDKVATGGRLNATKVLEGLTGVRTQTVPPSSGGGGGALGGLIAMVMVLVILWRRRKSPALWSGEGTVRI